MVLLAFNSCKHDPAIPPVSSNNDYNTFLPCDSDSIYFANTVLPLIVSNCAMSGCHDQTTQTENVVLTDYNSIMVTGKVKKFKPQDSELYEVIEDESMPYGGTPFTLAQKQIIYDWIMQGAQNNHCSSCDTSALATYSGFVAPLMQAKCTGCHSGSNPSYGIDLTTWQNVNTVALSGQLQGCIEWTGNYKQMPYQSNKLPDCEINKVTEWINNGALNN